jgi:hypothetical protein
MSRVNTKKIFVNVRDLSLGKSEQYVVDLIRYLIEQLPQINLERTGNELEITLPIKISKKVIRLRIRKFLYQKGLTEEFRPISFKTDEKDGYIVKEKKIIQISYY